MGTTASQKICEALLCLPSMPSCLLSSYLEYPAPFLLAFLQNRTHFSHPAKRPPPPRSLPQQDNSLPLHYSSTLLYSYNLCDPMSTSLTRDCGSRRCSINVHCPELEGEGQGQMRSTSHLLGGAQMGRSYSTSASCQDKETRLEKDH